MRKASKRLINAIIALVASVILCIGACLAWFAMNSEVTGNGLQTQVKGSDIVDFNVTAYYLDYSSTNKNYSVVAGDNELIKDANGTKLTIDHNGDKIINSLTSTGTTGDKDVMRPYSVNGGYTTAVLFKVEYEIVDGSSKKFRIFAECDEDSRLKVTEVSKDKFKSYLSNTVTFVSATQSATASGSSTFAEGSDTTPNYTYTAGETTTAFVGGVGLREKTFNINLSDGITTASLGEEKKNSNGNYENTEYFIMDYEKERFTFISSLLLERGGGLNSSLTLTGDVVLGIEEYTEGETVTPTDIAVDTLAYNYSTAYKQSMGADIMTPNWQFVVTYSDGSQKVIVGTNPNLNITGVTTTTVGNGTATATYTGGTAKAISCSVPYTVTPANIPVTGVKLDKTSATLTYGVDESLKLTATVYPSSASQTVAWTSDKESVATVSNGVVTVVGKGTATITATATDGSTATCTITVVAKTYTVTFYDDDGTTVISFSTLEEGAAISKPANPEKTGYTFDGWYTAESGGEKVESFGTITKDENYYAHWTASGSGGETTSQIHNFTTDGKDSTFFKITGNLSKDKGSVPYNGLTLTQCLKMESSTSIAFEIPKGNTATLTLVFAESGKSVKVDGSGYTTNANGIATVELQAGSHTITKGDSINLFYIVVTYTPATTT